MSGRGLITVLLRLGPRAKAIQAALLVTVIATLVLPMTAAQAVAELPSARLDRGFLRLYDLDFNGAQKEFEMCIRDSASSVLVRACPSIRQ